MADRRWPGDGSERLVSDGQLPDHELRSGRQDCRSPAQPTWLVYKSWKAGVGHMVHLWFDPDKQVYGLKRWPNNGGEFWTPIPDTAKPKQIDQHGTMVTLLGLSDEHDTMEAPASTPSRSRWILRYLNTRYFRFPAGVAVKAREGWEFPKGNKYNFLRAVEGQGAWLDKNAQQLIEAVMSAQALKQTGNWSINELEELWDESALTAAVLPRWHIDQTIRRTPGMRLGSLRPA